ncbi:hypothetical protein [Methylosinus sp. KRF6]|uniref:hypothetical protein n=1 Tax=Methylosinus sp. KRF6 TaxID=2846853 RepID=UPI001C0AD69E|nr:hypothetical protein [Methylosinus sp. KRF6]MBU3886837.1 hypothetical protein [Methylosinus sp. KRF6]
MTRRLSQPQIQKVFHYIKIGTSEVRRVKNLYSERSVVLHPEPIRLGFLDYVVAMRALGYEMVFPDLKSPTSSSPLGDRLYDELIARLHQAIPDAEERKKVGTTSWGIRALRRARKSTATRSRSPTCCRAS